MGQPTYLRGPSWELWREQVAVVMVLVDGAPSRHRVHACREGSADLPVLTLSYYHITSFTSPNQLGNQAQRMRMSCERGARDRDNW